VFCLVVNSYMAQKVLDKATLCFKVILKLLSEFSSIRHRACMVFWMSWKWLRANCRILLDGETQWYLYEVVFVFTRVQQFSFFCKVQNS
jgi:hypothetical protein